MAAENAQLRGDQAAQLCGYRQAGADHGHDRRQAGAGVGQAIRALLSVQGIAGPGATKAATVEHRQGHGALLVWAEALCLGPDKTLLAQQLADFVARHAGDDRQVEVLALQQLCRRLAMHLHLHQRMALREAREDARQKTHHIVIRGADADGANHVRLAQGAEDFAMQVENASGVAQQYLALAVKAHLAAFAFEQAPLHHVIFQAFHLHADCRLGAVQVLGRAGKAAVIGNGYQGAQQFGVDAGEVGH